MTGVDLPAVGNVRLLFRPVGARFERYPEWVQELRDVSGVYVIRLYQTSSPEIVYVGESHGDRLYGTLTRHFQTWSRQKHFWDGQYTAHDPGLSYPRERCDAAALVTPRGRAVEIQNSLIRWLRPRDNIVGAANSHDDWQTPDEADVIPF